jgi:hypothetical protein
MLIELSKLRACFLIFTRTVAFPQALGKPEEKKQLLRTGDNAYANSRGRQRAQQDHTGDRARGGGLLAAAYRFRGDAEGAASAAGAMVVADSGRPQDGRTSGTWMLHRRSTFCLKRRCSDGLL